MELATSAAYRQALEKIDWSREHGYGVFHLTDEDVALGRLFAYAFRTQTVGAFRATRMLLERRPGSSVPRGRAIDGLRGLEELSLAPVPADFRALVGTLTYCGRRDLTVTFLIRNGRFGARRTQAGGAVTYFRVYGGWTSATELRGTVGLVLGCGGRRSDFTATFTR